jgi:hypothetical protein
LAVARTLAFSGKALVSREELLTEYEAVCEELGVGRVEVSETLKKMKQLGTYFPGWERQRGAGGG